MRIDLAVLGAGLVFGLLGIFSGAVKQLSHWVGLALGYLASDPLAARLTPWVAGHTGLRPMILRVGLGVALFPLLYLCGAFVVQSLLKALIPERRRDFVDKAGGFVLGAGKAFVLAYVLLSALIFYEKPLSSLAPSFSRQSQGSKAAGLVRTHNLFAVVHLPAVGGVEKLLEAGKDPAAARALAQDPEVKALMDDPRLKAVLSDPRLMEAIKSGDAAVVAESAKLKELLADPKTAEKLSGLTGEPNK